MIKSFFSRDCVGVSWSLAISGCEGKLGRVARISLTQAYHHRDNA